MESPKSVKLVHWNILDPNLGTAEEFQKVDPKFLDWNYRQKKIVEIIDQEDPDLLSISEALGPLPLAKADDYHFEFKKKSDFDHGVLIGFKKSRFELLDVQVTNYTFEGQPTSQSMIYYQLKLKNGPNFGFISTHLKAKNFPERRLESVNQMLSFIFSRVPQVEPLFIAGDFNAEPSEYCISHLMNKTGLMSVLPDTISTQKCYKSSNFKLIQRKIDYIFYDPYKITLTDERSLDKEVADQEFGCPCEACPSDHLPIFATFQWI